MNKSALRASAIHDVGARLDDELETAQRVLHSAAGSVASLGTAARDVGSLVQQVQAKVDSGDIDLGTAETVINWIEMAKNMCLNLQGQARVKGDRLEGAVTALKTAIEVTSKMHTSESAKSAEMEVIPDASADAPRKTTIKEQRLAEAATSKKVVAKKKSKKAKKKRAKKKKA